MNKILTPISLWKDFECPTPVPTQVLSECKKEELIYREITICGRKTEYGSVTVYGMEIRPDSDEKMPALLLLSSAETPIDIALGERYARRGYCVFCMDYRGKTEKTPGTIYPGDVAYAYYKDAETTILHAYNGAKKTAWYEWTAAARYAVQYLLELPYVSSVGAMGIREGGEIVWKLMTFGDLCCGVCVNAAGWLAYREKSKYASDSGSMDEDERLFIAGIDSQSYAPFVKCPVLMLISVTDTYTDIDRAYDTYARIHADYLSDSTIDYSLGYNGTIDELGERDADMFMDKFLKNREMFIARPPLFSFEEKDDVLYAVIDPNDKGEAEEGFVCYTENAPSSEIIREWMTEKNVEEREGKFRYPVAPYVGADTVFAFGRVRYSSGSTVSSKIAVKKTKKTYKNGALHSNILYDSFMEVGPAFLPADTSNLLFSAFSTGNSDNYPVQCEGYGKIVGASCLYGLKTYRISDGRYLPSLKSLLHFDVYSAEDCELCITIEAGENEKYTDTMSVNGGAKWQSYLAEAGALHNEMGTALSSFLAGKALTITEKDNKKFIVTNILWI